MKNLSSRLPRYFPTSLLYGPCFEHFHLPPFVVYDLKFVGALKILNSLQPSQNKKLVCVRILNTKMHYHGPIYFKGGGG